MKPRRLPPKQPASPTYRQIWRVVDGAVASAFAAHPEYLATPRRARTVRNSIVKRVAGALNGYAEQSAWVRSGSSPADEAVGPRLVGSVEGGGSVASSSVVSSSGDTAGGARTAPPAHGGRS